jgi:squalene-associated FAD-dependent desaturase
MQGTRDTSERTVIVGGGLAGLAAAVALAGRGIPVTLLESRNRLGGRASSFVDATTGETIDNCQHVSMGCCTNLAHFCRTVGTEGLFRTERALTFIGPDGATADFSESHWPAPLHLFPSFLRLKYLSWRDRWKLARGLRALARDGRAESSGESFADWLRRHGQTPELCERFWHVVLVSALSESLERIDVHYARKVFVDGFLANREGWRVLIPTAPLDELYGGSVNDWLTRHGAEVRMSAAARELEYDGSAIRAVVLRDGERIMGSQFMLAAPHFRVLPLLPEELRRLPEVARIGELESGPISSVHLWFDRAITDLPHAVFVSRLSQWMFNRTRLWGRSPGPEGHCYQVVISASREVEERTQDQTIADVVAELAAVWPAAQRARLLRGRVVTERRAVFSAVPGVDRLRPGQQSPVPNLQFAGDWTSTGWPATMEGAVRSGYLAAGNVLARIGRPAQLVQPGLPVARLSRWLLGLDAGVQVDHLESR